MTNVQRAVILACAIVGFSFTIIPVAGAYLDPASGSIIIQAVIGGIAAVGIALATFWRKLGRLFSRGDKGAQQETPQG